MSNVIDMQGRQKMSPSGFVQLPLDFVEAIAKARISQQESQVLWAIIRKTLGWNKATDVISGSQLSSMTGLTRQRCAKVLVSLIEKGIVVRHGGSRSGLSIEQDATLWASKKKKSSEPHYGSVNTPTKTGSVSHIMAHSVSQKVVHTTDKTYKNNNTPSEYGDLAAEEAQPSEPCRVPETDTATDTTPRRKPKVETAPVQDIIDLYHACLPTLPVVRKLTDKRVKLIRARWNDTYLSSAEPGVTKTCNSLTFWRDLFDYVAQSDFLTGKVQPTAGRSKPFQADLEWLLNESNLAKILEGKYHG